MSDTCDTNLPVYPPSQCFPPDFCPRPPWWNQDPCGCNQQPEWGYWSHKMKRDQQEVQYLEDTLKSILTKWGYQPNGGIDPRIGAIISPAAPLNPWPGMLWFNPITNVLYIWSGNAGVMSWIAMTNQPNYGVTDGSNAPAGVVGEFITYSMGGQQSLNSGQSTVLGAMPLEPGDWEVYAIIQCVMNGVDMTTFSTGYYVNATSVLTAPTMMTTFPGVQQWFMPVSRVRANLANVAGNVQLNCMATYTGGTGQPSAAATMYARRMH